MPSRRSPHSLTLYYQQSATDARQVNIAMALTSCGGGLCPDDPSQWPMGQVVYNGPFNPQADPSRPQLGLVEDFLLEVPEGLPAGDAVLSVYHLENIGVSFSQSYRVDLEFDFVPSRLLEFLTWSSRPFISTSACSPDHCP